jgi:hypothetical protein
MEPTMLNPMKLLPTSLLIHDGNIEVADDDADDVDANGFSILTVVIYQN